MTYPASSKIQNLNDCTPLLLWLTNITVDQFILLMSGINIYALRSPYIQYQSNEWLRHRGGVCCQQWAAHQVPVHVGTVHCRRCRCARVMFTHSPLHTMNRLGWLCTNKQQTKNCKQLNLNTRRENTLWENTVWNVETPPDKIHRKSSREKRKKTYCSNWMQKLIYW